MVGAVGPGLLVYAAAGPDDLEEDLLYLARKILGLRIFQDAEGKMNLDVRQVGGGILLVSQFTLYADSRKGNRPAFNNVMEPVAAAAFIDRLRNELAAAGVPVQCGVFGADMQVASVNNGPVTILLDSKKLF